MSKQDNINGWITYVYRDWLFATDKGSSLIGSSQIIVNKMKVAIREDNTEKVWHLIERLKKISDLQWQNDRRVEKAETLLECGIAAYKVKDLTGAILLLDESARGYTSDAHFRATVIWIRSCIQWMLPSLIEDAISGWEQSRSLFMRLQTRSSLYAEWYEERVEEMRRAIDRATEKDEPQPYTKTQNARAPTRTKMLNERRDILRTYPVFGQIPAGQPLTLDLSTGWLDVDEVILDDEHYRIVNLQSNEQIIQLRNDYRYYLLEVIGNSMNIANPTSIRDNDFVLLREQNTANNQDIVAAEIVGDDDRATLKRYYEDNREISLRPESDDDSFTPIYVEEALTDLDNKFLIRGLAIAVLKKITD